MNNLNISTKHNIFLDLIRGIAVLLVLKSHWLYFDIEKFGSFKDIFSYYNQIEQYYLNFNRYIHPGVLIFIVLSGFIIHHTNLTLPKMADLRWSIKFILKRFARIYPVFILALLLGYGVQHFYYNTITAYEISVLSLNALMLYGLDYIQPPYVNNILVTVQSEFWIYMLYALIFPFLTNSLRWVGFLVFSFTVWIGNYLIYTNNAESMQTVLYWSKNNSFAYVLYWCIGAYAAELCKSKNIQNLSWYLPIALFFASVSITPLQTAKWSYLVNELLIAVTVAICIAKLSFKFR